MKAKELRERSEQELKDLGAQLRKELFQNRMKNATGQLGDTSTLKKAKKTLARVNSIASERAAATKKSAAAAKSTGSEA
jgi:large subunit ribosomal protein L29